MHFPNQLPNRLLCSLKRTPRTLSDELMWGNRDGGRGGSRRNKGSIQRPPGFPVGKDCLKFYFKNEPRFGVLRYQLRLGAERTPPHTHTHTACFSEKLSFPTGELVTICGEGFIGKGLNPNSVRIPESSLTCRNSYQPKKESQSENGFLKM